MASARQTSLLNRLIDNPPSLEGGVELSVHLTDRQHGELTFRQGDVSATMNAVGLSVPYPSGLRRVLASESDVDLVVVERIPPGLQPAASAEHVSILDLRGQGYVTAPGFAYVVASRPDLGQMIAKRSSPFARKASRVVRALLSDPQQSWRLSDVARLSHLNPGNVHRALAALSDLGMLERDEDAYLVTDPGSLLEAWGDQAQQPSERVVLKSDGDLLGTVRELVSRFEGEVVVSGELAAETLAPHLPSETAIVHLLDPESFATVQRDARPPRSLLRAGLVPGEILVDLADEGYGDFGSERDGLPLASSAQIYVDLVRDRGRGREAAEHLRRTELGF